MSIIAKQKIEFGDFQTPTELAEVVCRRLVDLGLTPDIVVEPTCGVGAFVLAAAKCFSTAQTILGCEINPSYLNSLRTQCELLPEPSRIQLQQADFFGTDWKTTLHPFQGSNILVLGNFPWVTNTAQAVIEGNNLPEKSNFQKHRGFEAISGTANFDISEAMLLEVIRWFQGKPGDVAMLVKTAVARKVLAHLERQDLPIREAFLVKIDAKKDFNAAVEACLLVIRLSTTERNYDYTIYERMSDTLGRRVGHRQGLTVGNLDTFERHQSLVGQSPQKWRSGIKHDASAIMEFTRTARGLENGKGEIVDLESEFLYPLLKGSDIGSAKAWREKYLLVPQQFVGQSTLPIKENAPKTWAYLEKHSDALSNRGSIIYSKAPRFAIFGVGEYAFRPWRIAICSLYKHLRFRLIGPIDERPVMFDDTVYYLSFATEAEAVMVLELINSVQATELLQSLIFWDDKRPIKTSLLNSLDWTRLAVNGSVPSEKQLGLDLTYHNQ